MQARPIQASGVITTAGDFRARCLFLFLLLPFLSMVSFCKQIKYSAHVQYKIIIDSINTFRMAPFSIMETRSSGPVFEFAHAYGVDRNPALEQCSDAR